MNKILISIITLVLSLTSFQLTNADVLEDMKDFFDKSGGNFTGPEIFQDQQAGYMSLGGYYKPNRVKDIRPFHVESPSLKIGTCGDINMHLGGMSFLGNDLIGSLKNIMTSASTYGMLIALETQFPQITSNIKQLQSWANQINSIGVNSCEAGTALVGALLPQKSETSQMICRTQSAFDGKVSDYIKGRHRCTDSNTYNNEIKIADEKYPQIFKDEYNIAWQVLGNHPLFTGGQNEELRYFFMSMTGTVISKKGSSGQMTLERKESLAKNAEFMKALINAEGSSKIYYCKDTSNGGTNKCLDVGTKDITLKSNMAFKSKITELLTSMQKKVRASSAASEQQFSVDEIALINKTHIPVLKIINVMAAAGQGSAPVLLTGYADEIAIDLVCKYITEILDIADYNANLIRGLQVQVGDLEKFIENIADVRKIVDSYETKARIKVERLFQLEQKLHLLEKDIYTSIRAQLK